MRKTARRHEVREYRHSGTYDVVRSDGALLGADLNLVDANRLAARLNEEWEEEMVYDHGYHDTPAPHCPLCVRRTP